MKPSIGLEPRLLDGHHPMVNNHQPPIMGPSPQDQQPPPGHMMGPQRPMLPPESSPFMQQHSQIFVFSTDLANQAAAAVCQGQCKTIIDFHLEQPGIKEMLQVRL